ncbi:MAG TPA: thermonuclease family protein [Rubrivivax sp.]|nr:thermonuclease family protein [Rubrivivax sp.]
MNARYWRVCAALALAGLWLAPAWGKPPSPKHTVVTVQGVVTHVTDGDSLWVTPPGQPGIEVRLRDIDAPEICQVWGEEARRALEERVLGRTVVLRTAGRDTYGRTLGYVQFDGVDVGRRMVEEGHAWSTRTRWDRGPLVKEERMADALRRGLHGLPGAVMPRDFRQGHGPCVADPSAERAAPTPTPRPLRQTPEREPRTAMPPPGSALRCDGRTHCSQMTSCEEARFFLNNCPGVKMDGNNDGVPCERQWCRP